MQQTQKNLYLLKMGADAQNGFNHRIRFISNDIKANPDIEKIVIDFQLCSPLEYYKKFFEKALYFEIFAYYKNDFETCRRYTFPNEILETLETFESYYKINSIKYIYNYENILKLCNYLLQENFNNIVLLEPRFIKNFDFETFKSDTLVFNSLSYNNAVELASYAKNKIMQDLKPGSKYDNTFYRFHEGKFEISILYNCYNDIIIIDNIENLDAAKKQIDNIKRPDALIKEAIKKYYSKYFQNIKDININKLYI